MAKKTAGTPHNANVDHAMRTAHHGRAAANVPMPKGRMDAEDRRDGGRDEGSERGYGPVRSGQKGHPGTD